MKTGGCDGQALLSRGDLVQVVATGFVPRKAALRRGIARLESWGFRVRPGEHLDRAHGYLAGTDRERSADLEKALLDPEVRAVWFARGGYGTARLLDGLPWNRIRRIPRTVLGYSDLTALFCYLLRGNGRICLHAPVVTELGDTDAFHAGSLRALLRGTEITLRFGRRAVLAPGRATGRLVGGNLSVLAHLLGTRYLPSLDGAILALEDIGEETYRLDRLFNHLRQARVLRRVAGVCLGQLESSPRKRRFPPDRPLAELLEEFLGPLGIPVVTALPFGHVAGKRSLPLGGMARLDTSRGTLRLSPRPVP